MAIARENEQKSNRIVGFLADVLRGVMIGVAFIIPGFSGGSVAAILGIYEKLVDAITGLFKNFKESFLFLLPVLLGMIVGIGGLIFPIKFALEAYPIPTVCLFIGLSIGGLPSVTEKMQGGKVGAGHILSCLLPLFLAGSIGFLPTMGEVDLFALDFGGYLLLFLMGIVGSMALVVPGISGSMLLLIFGYYNPILSLVTDHILKGDAVGTGILILLVVAVGIVVGFFGISFIMKWLLKKYPRATYFGIFGFIVGSVPTILVKTVRDAGYSLTSLPSSPWYWIVSVLLLAVGVAISLVAVFWARRKKAKLLEEE